MISATDKCSVYDLLDSHVSVKVTVQFERCFRLMEDISVIS